MDEKSQNLFRIEDVPTLGTPKKTITTKPYFAIYMSIIVGILFIISVYMQILGWIILVFALLVLWKTPNYKQLEFFDKSIVIYKRLDKENCIKIDYDDVVEWVSKSGNQSGDLIMLKLQNDEYEHIETYRAAAVVSMLNKIMPDKELNRRKNAQMKNTPFKWPWSKK